MKILAWFLIGAGALNIITLFALANDAMNHMGAEKFGTRIVTAIGMILVGAYLLSRAKKKQHKLEEEKDWKES